MEHSGTDPVLTGSSTTLSPKPLYSVVDNRARLYQATIHGGGRQRSKWFRATNNCSFDYVCVDSADSELDGFTDQCQLPIPLLR